MTETVTITFKYENGEQVKITDAPVGATLLELAREHDVSIEGACGGVCACATCHVWVDDPWFDQLPEASDSEEDMLDNGQQLKPNSRLCCQILITKDMDGMIVTIPKTSENISGHHH